MKTRKSISFFKEIKNMEELNEIDLKEILQELLKTDSIPEEKGVSLTILMDYDK
ncbi:MAG: hypothetical protein LBL07_06145 [Tannerella sp.]|jgi:hypothetical protein|nr:hypothetical protein [Tannerella sp.]